MVETVRQPTALELSMREIETNEWHCIECFTLKLKNQFATTTVCKDCK